MGFDIYGIQPSHSPVPDFPSGGSDKEKEAYYAWRDGTDGAYYRQSVWGWRPLWEFVCIACDGIVTDKDANNGWYNGGHKISKTKTKRIAAKIRRLVKNGFVDKYVETRNKVINAMPNEDCEICDGTGKRTKPPKTGAGDIKCNGCDGKGHKRPWVNMYHLDKETVIEFGEFCEHSGGFKIL